MSIDTSIKVLVVDDFATMRRIVRGVLKQMGFTKIVEAVDGAVAYETLKKEPDVNLIGSDWNMPNMTGLEFLKTVRADPKFKHLPFLMVTAEAGKENINPPSIKERARAS